MGIDDRLLILLEALHNNLRVKIRIDQAGRYTNEIPSRLGVWQGCVLAPTLFNLYINDLPAFLFDESCHPPSVNGRPIGSLLYADDLIILSQSPVGLRRAFKRLENYCARNELKINQSKTKVIIFGQGCIPKYKWKIGNLPVEQVTKVSYLGITFSSSGNWNAHVNKLVNIARLRSQTLLKLFRTKVPNTVMPVLKVYLAKILPILTFGAEIWGLSITDKSETPQNIFLKSILGVPNSALNAAVRAELGIYTVETSIVVKPFYYWSRINEMEEHRFPRACLVEQVSQHNSWLNNLFLYNAKIGLADILPERDNKKAYRQRIRDINIQTDLSKIASGQSHSWLSRSKTNFALEKYLKFPLRPSYRVFYTRARFDLLESEVLQGRYHKSPYNSRLCPLCPHEIEDTTHIIFNCPLYAQSRSKLRLPNLTNIFIYQTQLHSLLFDATEPTVRRVAKFLQQAAKTRLDFLASNAVDCRHDSILKEE